VPSWSVGSMPGRRCSVGQPAYADGVTSRSSATDTTGAVRSDPRRPGDGFGELVHPHSTDLLLQRDRLPITVPSLMPYTEWFWSVRWVRHGQPLRTSEVIPNPVCHLTFEDGRRTGGEPLVRHGVRMPAAVVTTVWTRRFRVQLAGEGRTFGLRFRPGGLSAMIGAAVAADQSLGADDLLPGAAAVLPRVLAEQDDTTRRDIVQQWLAQLAPEPSVDYLLATDLVAWSFRDSAVVRVEQVAARAGLSVRGVQRLFRQYVGVPPKWVLMRCRLQDAAAALDTDPEADLAEVATRLGWYDQSHFVRDFRRFLGVTPGRYARDAHVSAQQRALEASL